MTCIEKAQGRKYYTISIIVPADLYELYCRENKRVSEIRKKSPRIRISRLAAEALRDELIIRGLIKKDG